MCVCIYILFSDSGWSEFFGELEKNSRGRVTGLFERRSNETTNPGLKYLRSLWNNAYAPRYTMSLTLCSLNFFSLREGVRQVQREREKKRMLSGFRLPFMGKGQLSNLTSDIHHQELVSSWYIIIAVRISHLNRNAIISLRMPSSSTKLSIYFFFADTLNEYSATCEMHSRGFSFHFYTWKMPAVR